MKPVPTLRAEIRAVRSAVGLWLRESPGFVRIVGADAASWLQSQTSNDVEPLESGQGCANAHLDRKGHLIGHFTLHRWDDEYWMLVDDTVKVPLLQSLDAHLFIEDARIEDGSGEVDQIAVQGARAVAFLAALLDSDEAIGSELLPAEEWGIHPVELLGYQVFAVRLGLAGEDGFVLIAPAGEGQGLIDSLLESQSAIEAALISPEAQDVLRIEAGIPRYIADMDASNRLPETTLERTAVSYEKGCYVGQEVIAKLRAYGTVRRALMGLVFDGETQPPPPGTCLNAAGAAIGHIRSATYSPTLERPIALAYLDRDYREPGRALTLEWEGGQGAAQVVVLPFVRIDPPAERARRLYETALDRFERDDTDSDVSAIDLLKEAVLLDPRFEDAYETLGVILHRHGRVDEAIHYMTRLAALNPDCLMAHTNLSVFYVAKGMIEEAEEEKAKASVLQMQQANAKVRAEEMAAQERERLRAEALERIAMFAEVLEFDPEDPLATFGTGQSYMQLQDYESAIPFLEKAAHVQKDYSAAYLNLGKCCEFVGRIPEAAAAYKAGIAAANRKGDFMPLREMERRLAQLGPAS